MKKTLAVAVTVVLVGGLVTFAAARPRGGGWGGGNGPGNCWQENSENRGGNGPCWDGEGRRGRGNGPGSCREGGEFSRSEGDVDTEEKASEIVTSFITRTGNPNLKAGKVTEAGRDYEVEIVTQEGSLANKVFIEKRSGRVIPAYR